MKPLPVLVSLLFLSGCATYSEFRASPERYTSMSVNDVYELQEDMMLLKYDYLIIPLVKPGLQLMAESTCKESELSSEFKVVAHVRKGTRLKISGYENEGGWIPCHGDYYMVNPMATFLDGDLKGKKVGISLLCKDGTDQIPFRTGKIYFASPNDKLIKKN